MAVPPRSRPRSRRTLVLRGFVAAVVALSILHFLPETDVSLERHLRHANVLAAIATGSDQHAPWFNATTEDGDLATDYECVGWQGTNNSSPNDAPAPELSQDCEFHVHEGLSGYCVYRHTTTGALRRVLPVYSDTMYRAATFHCARAPELVTFSARSVAYVHDPSFSFEANQHEVRAAIVGRDPTAAFAAADFERGVIMVVHSGVLASAYVSVRILRETGATLPVEMWFKRDEVDPSHALLVDLVAHYGVFLREIHDPRATKYFTKLYAVFYSAFDHVLLLDADNFAVRDPTFLFDTDEYRSTGAIFWPDFWQPRQTTFNVQPHSLVWSILGVPFIDMMEQESGQVLVNRRQHRKALNTLLFYGLADGARVIDELQLAWGDKDLFRFAWLRTASPFHFITRHAGSAGRVSNASTTSDRFCGITIVQHDPRGEILFLHRNNNKLQAGNKNARLWTHVQQFRRGAPPEMYSIGPAKLYDDINVCWGNANPDEQYYSLTPIDEFPFREIEQRMFALAIEAAEMEQRQHDDRIRE